ncbi:FAD-binding monooxygenase [Actinomadura sp. KC06]|uniref:FAD-dependent monooxygenase n=1 Tax=Actinomadura sp. KC06 TaxID=2530369 RepID=UPI0010463673|nr:FAD-dependent monooxygenase [Actinomadura sp. KC06]TDD26267.1 FAD-binding monooxygenase [Actinomadura sp. KC06]
MTDAPNTDVLIIGAGPTGLTLACDLARRGVASRIVERDAVPNRASKAKTIKPRSLEVLDDLGVVEHVLRRGVVWLPVRFHEPSGAVLDKPPISDRADQSFSTPYPDSRWIGQFDIEYALRQRLEELGGRVEFGAEAVGLEQDDDGVTVALRTSAGERTVRARYVVGADGGRSSTRRFVGLPLVGKTYERQRWYLGDVTVPDLDRSHMHIWPSERGMLGLTPLPGGDLWQFQSPILPDDEPGTPSLEFYQRLFDERVGKGAVVLESATWLSVYQVNARVVEDYRKGRVLLAGDAAHVHSPAGGQGMNTGIQDAYNLGWKLTSVIDGARQSLLDTYTAERLPVARTVLELSTEKMTRTMEQAGRGSEDGLGSALDEISDGSMTTGLGIHYRTGPITYPGGERRTSGPVAGDRAPNADGLEGAGFSGDLFDLMRGPHWSLIAFEHTEPVVFDNAKPTHMHVHRIGSSPDSAIVDVAGEFRRIYDPYPGELILVRTDGYIAARVPAGQEMDVINHLAPFRSIGNQVRPY